MARVFARIKHFIWTLLVVTVCLGAIGGVGVYFLTKYGKGETADRARAGVEKGREWLGMKARDVRKDVGAWRKDVAEDLGAIGRDDGDTTGVLKRMRDMFDQLTRTKEKGGPQYREGLEDLKTRAQTAYERLKESGQGATEAAKQLIDRIDEAIDEAVDDSGKEREATKSEDEGTTP